MDPVVVLILGVSGSGKSTVGRALARALGGTFLEGDDFHPDANVARMAAGIPLTDADREPWLDRLVLELQRRQSEPAPIVLTCSALKKAYREHLRKAVPGMRMVYLKGCYEQILRRMEERPDHFMKPEMLRSQFTDLEEPRDAVTVDIGQPVETMVPALVKRLGSLPPSTEKEELKKWPE